MVYKFRVKSFNERISQFQLCLGCFTEAQIVSCLGGVSNYEILANFSKRFSIYKFLAWFGASQELILKATWQRKQM